ncbi:MAG: NUDIX hydrolase [Desulfobacteraceae bacterium]|nr:MAG: NUDIX hydrolase [Desulfobacteraceae bacterium]
MFETRYEDAEGRDRVWRFVSRKNPPRCVSGVWDIPDAVVIVAFHAGKNRLVIIREFRVPLGDYQYGLPAGLVDKGETVADSASRELFEETGLTVTRWIKTSPLIYSSSGMTDESIALVYVECAGEPSSRGNTASEDIETLLVTQEEAAALCRDECIKVDVKTWLVLSMYGATGTIC